MAAELPFKSTMAFSYGEASVMAPGVRRLVANNAGPLTFKGTNTYLVGSATLAVVDPGPHDPAHRAAILRAAGERPITHILITHAHRDHVDGAAALKDETGANICGLGRDPRRCDGSNEGLSGTEFIDHDFAPDVLIRDGERIEGADWSLSAIHTPGHAPDHLCFALEGSGILFSGDHVMAWNTSVVAPPEGRMADYLSSLEHLLTRRDKIYLPGHGGRIEEPGRTVKAYLLHRQWREQAVLTAVREGANTIRKIVPIVYREIDRHLSAAALLSVLAHVEHLIERNLLRSDGPLTADCVLSSV